MRSKRIFWSPIEGAVVPAEEKHPSMSRIAAFGVHCSSESNASLPASVGKNAFASVNADGNHNFIIRFIVTTSLQTKFYNFNASKVKINLKLLLHQEIQYS